MKINIKGFKKALFSDENVERMLEDVYEREDEIALEWSLDQWESNVFGYIGYHGTFIFELVEENREYFKEYIKEHSLTNDENDIEGYYEGFYQAQGDIEPFNEMEPKEFFKVVKSFSSYLSLEYPAFFKKFNEELDE